MAIPATTYDIATISNPTTALTDFTLIVDLSNMSAAWWLAVDTSDGTKGRVSKGDGVTELASDWIEFNNVAKTGKLRVKWTGTLASTGTQELRIYPPVVGNPSYGVSDTYGQYNAYDSDLKGYYPAGGGNDRTINQNNMSGNGGISVGGVPGKIGAATAYNGSTQWSDVASSDISSRPLSVLAWFNPVSSIDQTIAGVFPTIRPNDYFAIPTRGGGPFVWDRESSNNTGGLFDIGSMTLGAWNQSTGISASLTARKGSSNGTAFVNNTADLISDDGTWNSFAIGRSNDSSPNWYFGGSIQEVQFWNSELSESWSFHEYSQTNDNTSFWGTWTNVPIGTQEVVIEPIVNEPESAIASLLSGKSINPAVNEPESIVSILLSGKSITTIIHEPESITVEIKNRLSLAANVSESETVTVNLQIDGPVIIGLIQISMNLSKKDVSMILSKKNITMELTT